MKYLLSFIMLFAGIAASAQEFSYTYEGQTLRYEILNKGAKTCKVINYLDLKGALVIPEKVLYEQAEYSVTSIGKRAFNGCRGLTSVAIPSSVTSIGSSAFYNCSGLTSVNIPSSVTSIESSAFYNCRGLTSVNIPSSVTSIGYSAFSGCSGLTSVNIPSSVTSIGSYAFDGCSGLTSVNIPSSVTSIGSSAFDGCSGLTSVNIPSSVTSIGSSAFDGCSGLTSVNIPSSVTSIGSYAFSGCSGLTSVNIPSSVTSIGYCAFFGCSGLTSVNIPSSVTSIGDYAFSDCRGLTEVTIPSSITSIGSYAFCDCRGLTSVNIPSSVTSIGDRAFYNCCGLTSVTIPSSVTSIGSGAFSGCRGLTEVTISSSVTSIGSGAFSGCSGLTSVNIPSSVTSIEHDVFNGCGGLTEVTLPSSVTAIGSGAFVGCDGLESVYSLNPTPPALASNGFGETVCHNATLYVPGDALEAYKSAESWRSFSNINLVLDSDDPVFIYTHSGTTLYYRITDAGSNRCEVAVNPGVSGTVVIPANVLYQRAEYSVTAIGDNAFVGCGGLTEVTIPSSVTAIGNSAFDGCSGLTSIAIPSSVMSVGDMAFNGCGGLTEVTLPSSVTAIGSGAFVGCDGLESVYSLNPTPPALASNGFGETVCHNATLYVPGDALEAYKSAESWRSFSNINLVLDSDDPVFIYTHSGTTLYYRITDAGSNRCEVAVNPGVSGTVVIPANVLYQRAEYSVTAIGESAFVGCGGLASIEIPSSVTAIGNSAFDGCSGLASIEIPSSVTSVGDKAFNGCLGLTEITLPSSVTAIGSGAFVGCDGLESVYSLNPTPPALVSDGFSDVTTHNATLYVPGESLEAYKRAESWRSFSNINLVLDSDDPVFIYTHSGTTLYYRITDADAKKCEVAVNPGVSGTVVIPANVLYQRAEYSVTAIGDNAFDGCSGLASIEIPSSVTAIGNSAFDGCSGLPSVTIPSSVTSVGDKAFNGCLGLTEITLPSSVTAIGSGAFVGCDGLESVYSLNPTPPALASDGFSDVTTHNATLYVPGDALEAYKSAESWRSFSNINLVLDSDDPVFIYPHSGTTLYYRITDADAKTCEVAVNPGVSGTVVIPAKVLYQRAEYSVTAIGESAFVGCGGLASIEIPSSVTTIGNSAFDGCSGLPSVTIPSSVTSVGDMAFNGCLGLTEVTLPSSVTAIGSGAFEGCSGLADVNIHDIAAWCNVGFGSATANPAYYAKGLTLNGEKVRELVIPSSVKSIGKYAFINCGGLTSIDIPNSVTAIRDDAFKGCNRVSEINIHDIAAWCNISFGNIHSHPTYDARIIKLKLNGEEITDVMIPSSVTSIGDCTFKGCNRLASVIIPNSVTAIGDYAFYYCWDLASVAIPASVTSIGDYAFYYCWDMTSVTIPEAVTFIGDYAFRYCPKLTSVYSLSMTPPAVGGMSCFENAVYRNATLYVPQEALDAYRTADVWKDFGNIIGIDPTELGMAPTRKDVAPTGVADVDDGDKDADRIYYDMNGRRLRTPVRGLNIVNGRKVMMK